MKISYNWLKQYLDIPVDPETAARLLTDGGLEVEGLARVMNVKGGLEGLIVGEVVANEQHPNADRLSVNKVDVGGEELLAIVCGAPNVTIGQKVVIAPVGSTIHPLEGESFKIKRSKIRGELSEGMICAEDEIGLGTDHDGILVLDRSVQVGSAVANHYDIGEDHIIEIGLTPNRADATAHYGVARDLRAVLISAGHDHKGLDLKKPSVEGFTIQGNNLPIDVSVEDAEASPRYAGVSISGLKVAPSPQWLKERLLSIGLKPINNVVDVTNFVLHETGQPLHAFDIAAITGNKVVVKQVPEGTPFVTLDGEERKLSDKDLMICNAEEGMCIGGVFGGEKSGVSDSTTDIFLESAWFHPVSIRKTAKRHGLSTDASFRFERGVDPNNTIYALKRAALLIQEVAGGKIDSEVTDLYPNPAPNFEVRLSFQRCTQLIGQEIPVDTIKEILLNLEIEIVKEDESGLDLSVPPFKVDVQREADIIEEILRVYGYNRIATPEQLRSSISARPKPDLEMLQEMTSDLLSSGGFQEIMSNSLTKSSYFGSDSFWNPTENVLMANPLSNELDALRRTLLFSGLEALAYNKNRQVESLKLYEFGKTYAKGAEGYIENRCLALFATGYDRGETWNATRQKMDFYFIRGFADAVIQRLGIGAPGVREEPISDGIFSGGLSYTIANKEVARLGEVQSAHLERVGLQGPVFFANFNWDVVIQLLKVNKVKFNGVPRYPSVKRDLALMVDRDISFAQVQTLARKAEKALLQSIDLFDVYEGDKIAAGKKSYAVSFTFRDSEQTLTDKKIDKIMSGLKYRFEKELGAVIRGEN